MRLFWQQHVFLEGGTMRDYKPHGFLVVLPMCRNVLCHSVFSMNRWLSVSIGRIIWIAAVDRRCCLSKRNTKQCAETNSNAFFFSLTFAISDRLWWWCSAKFERSLTWDLKHAWLLECCWLPLMRVMYPSIQTQGYCIDNMLFSFSHGQNAWRLAFQTNPNSPIHDPYLPQFLTRRICGRRQKTHIFIWNSFHCQHGHQGPLVNLPQELPMFFRFLAPFMIQHISTTWPSWEISLPWGRRGVKGKPGVAGNLAVKFFALKKPAPLRLGWGGHGIGCFQK